MPQAGLDPPRQSHATYEASALLPSHHSWIRSTYNTLFGIFMCSKLNARVTVLDYSAARKVDIKIANFLLKVAQKVATLKNGLKPV